MGQIYDEIKGMITPEMIGTAAATLGEQESNVRSAVSTILPALLGRMLTDGITPHVIGVVDDAGEDKLIDKLPEIFKGHGIIEGKNHGERMENALIGPRNAEFPATIAEKRHVSVESADRLTNWVSAAIAAYFGDQVVGQKKQMVPIIQALQNEKTDMAGDVPKDAYARLGVSPIFGVPKEKAPAKEVSAKAAEPECPVSKREKEKNDDKGGGWLWWLILLLLVLILLLFWWRSCDKKKEAASEATKTENVQGINTKADKDKGKIKIKEGDKDNFFMEECEKIEETLPDGTKIIAYQGSCELLIVEFLNSEKYKNATAEELKGIWFEFDSIEFVHNSPNELMPGSMEQLKNLAAVLKSFPESKIRIGAYADATGTNAVNMDISKARAEYIKSVFIAEGIDAKRVSTEGFGEELATFPASASDDQRAKDRDIALRFEK